MLFQSKIRLTVLILLCSYTHAFVCSASAAEKNNTNELAKNIIYKFAETHCFTCHNEKKQKGKLRLDDSDFSFSTHASVYHWQDILDVLNTGEMPPEDEKQPSGEELASVIGEITTQLQIARNKLADTGGVITMRHLNRREYSGSIKDLFNAEVPTHALPLDQPEGWDTDGRQQFFTSNHYVMYYNSGVNIAESAISGIMNKGRTQKVTRIEPEALNNGLANRFLTSYGKGTNLEDYRGLSFEEIKKRTMKLYPDKLGRITAPRDIAYLLDENHKFGASGRVLAHFAVVPGYKYKLSVITFGNTTETAPLTYESGLDNNFVTDLKFSSDVERHKAEFTFQADLLHNKIGFKIYPPKGGYVDYFEFEPLESDKSAFEKIFENSFTKKLTTEELGKAFKQFSERAFRNISPDKNYIDSLISAYNDEVENGKTPKDALVVPIATILTSPAFLYIKEYNNGRRQALKAEEFATRLSYFLMGTPPDDALFTAAKQGELQQRKGLEAQVERMLHLERSERAMNDFFRQWMELDRFDQVTLSYSVGQFQESVKEEPLKFFNYIIQNNLPIENLIDSDFAVIDPTMASYYGIPGELNGFQSVKLPANSHRGGLLTQAAFLMMGTAGSRTSPTIRGTVIRAKFLNDPPPPPPPNVPQLATQENGTQTVRELVNLHKQVAQCSSCHEKIDPIGYGLENFDHLGKYRTEVRLKSKDKFPVDASGYITKGNSFSDLDGLKKVLLQEKDKLARSIFESLMSYGIGRKIEFIDKAEIDNSLTRLKKDNYRMKDMIVEIVNSNIFKTK